MNEEGDIARSELLDEEMGKKVVIAREVLHFHDFGRAPFCPEWLLVSRGRRGRDCHRGWLWSGLEKGDGGGRREVGNKICGGEERREERTDRQDKDLVTAQPTEHRTRTRNRFLLSVTSFCLFPALFAEKKNENMYHFHQQADTTSSSNTSHEASKREQPSFSCPRHQHRRHSHD